MQKLYNRYKKIIEYIIYPVALMILPLLNYNQGVDVSDSTYSLGNYLFANRLEGMWVISTYLSNKLGAIIMHLPGAKSLRCANVYMGLIVGLIGVLVYVFLKNDYDPRYVFLGEFIAICFCWIPKGILYNYLSYLMMAMGAITLYKGITKRDRKYYLAAGFILGLNVFVRIPNITQMSLIVSLWFVAYITNRKWVNDFACCVCGYIAGMVIPGICIVAQYGISGIFDMISGLSGITSADKTYTPLSMITGPIKAYMMSFKWGAVIVVVMVCGCIMFKIMPDRFTKLKTVVYVCVIVLMLRFFWGRGMYSFKYYEDYTSMYEWGIIALYLSLIADISVIIKALTKRAKIKDGIDENHLLVKESAMACICLVIIMIAPLGSNNNLYQNLNNLFVVMPFTVYVLYGWIKKYLFSRDYKSVPIVAMLTVLLLAIAIQSFGFNLNFVFRDGMRGEARDTKISNIPSLEGMYTNAENAHSLEDMYEYMSTNCSDAQELILFGDCPGLTYVLNKPSALFSSWIDLDSNPVEQIETELGEIAKSKQTVPVIIRKIEGSAVAYAQKEKLIYNFIDDNGYKKAYENEQYMIFAK